MPLDRRIYARRGEPKLSKFSVVSQIGLAVESSETTKIVSDDGAAVILVCCQDRWLNRQRNPSVTIVPLWTSA